MSEDITKFLSLPNSQDEIYKILGIKAPSAGEKDSERYRDKDKGRDN